MSKGALLAAFPIFNWILHPMNTSQIVWFSQVETMMWMISTTPCWMPFLDRNRLFSVRTVWQMIILMRVSLCILQSTYLNEINCSGIPLAKLQLKIGCPVMVLRNLYPADGVCNGTKGIVKRMSLQVIEIELISEEHQSKRIFIPRIIHIPSQSQVPFKFERKQFPLKFALPWPSTSHRDNQSLMWDWIWR